MISSVSIVLAAVLGAHSALAHGVILSPPSRSAGDAFRASCGDTAWYTENGDPYGNVQGLIQQGAAAFTEDCSIWQCKGLKFEDNKANVQTYSAGETIPFSVEIRAPHAGSANVSVINTATDSIIGSPMIEWASPTYASSATGPVAGQSKFDVTLPTAGMDVCSEPGSCSIQWHWAGDNDQTYQGCVDFVVGSGSATPAAPEEPVEEELPVEEETPVEKNPVEEPIEDAPIEESSSAIESAVEQTTEQAPAQPTTSVRPRPTTSTRPSSIVAPSVPTTTKEAAPPVVESPMPEQPEEPEAEVPAPAPSASSAPTTPGKYADYNECMRAMNDCKNRINKGASGQLDFATCDAITSTCNSMRRMKHKRRSH